MAYERLKTGQAKSLRRRMTAAETRLWSKLRAGRFHGLKWSRQEPIGQFIVDFYCSVARVVIELEGDAHGYTRTQDVERQKWLESTGLLVLRFPNDAVLNRLDRVMEEIFEACQSSLPDF